MSGALVVDGNLRRQASAFLSFCRIEKGLAANSLAAYTADLERFIAFSGEAAELPDADQIRHYLDSLYQARLSNRSIGRHLTTLRNFCRFLLPQGRIQTDPT